MWAYYVAIARNQYNKETSIINDVFGLSSIGEIPDNRKEPAKTGEKITVFNVENLEPVTFTGSLFKPQWKLSAGKPIALFKDGLPAILVSCSALTFSPYSVQCSYHSEFDKVRKIVSYAAELAGATKHCIIDVSRIKSFVREGENQTLVFLINSSGTTQKDIQIKLKV